MLLTSGGPQASPATSALQQRQVLLLAVIGLLQTLRICPLPGSDLFGCYVTWENSLTELTPSCLIEKMRRTMAWEAEIDL